MDKILYQDVTLYHNHNEVYFQKIKLRDCSIVCICFWLVQGLICLNNWDTPHWCNNLVNVILQYSRPTHWFAHNGLKWPYYSTIFIISLYMSSYITTLVGSLTGARVCLYMKSTWGWKTGTAACCPCGCVSISMVLGAWSLAPLRIKTHKIELNIDHQTKKKKIQLNSTITFQHFTTENNNLNQLNNCSLLSRTKLLSAGCCQSVLFQQNWNPRHACGFDTLCLGPSQVAAWQSYSRQRY